MNCKPGDLAVVVRSNCGNAGKLVVVVERAPSSPAGKTYQADGLYWYSPDGAPAWFVESTGGLLNTPTQGQCRRRPFADKHLRPIRDNDGDDETLSWASVPNVDAAVQEAAQKQKAESQ